MIVFKYFSTKVNRFFFIKIVWFLCQQIYNHAQLFLHKCPKLLTNKSLKVISEYIISMKNVT